MEAKKTKTKKIRLTKKNLKILDIQQKLLLKVSHQYKLNYYDLLNNLIEDEFKLSEDFKALTLEDKNLVSGEIQDIINIDSNTPLNETIETVLKVMSNSSDKSLDNKSELKLQIEDNKLLQNLDDIEKIIDLKLTNLSSKSDSEKSNESVTEVTEDTANQIEDIEISNFKDKVQKAIKDKKKSKKPKIEKIVDPDMPPKKTRKRSVEVIKTYKFSYNGVDYLVDTNSNVYTFNINKPEVIGIKLVNDTIEFF
jgi:hypothetical protein